MQEGHWPDDKTRLLRTMRNSFFNQPATVVTALLTLTDDKEGNLAMIRGKE